MAPGMAIMGFGGGAMIGSPLANALMNTFQTPASVGLWETLVVMAIGYFAYSPRHIASPRSAWEGLGDAFCVAG